MKNSKFWATLIAVLLALSLLGAFLTLDGKTDAAAAARVYQNGKLLRTIDLSSVDSSYSFTVEGLAGTNTVEVEKGRIRVSHADCPDQICVRQGWIPAGGVPIVCLPNALVIEVEDTGDTGVDGVTS